MPPPAPAPAPAPAPDAAERPAADSSVPRWLPALITLAAATAALPTLAFPHGRDQGSYAYAGWRLLHGELPYRDVVAFKPPGTVFVHAASAALFGTDAAAIRAFDGLWTVGTALAVAALTRALGGSVVAAAAAGVTLPWLYHTVDYWNVAQSDGWTNLPVSLALLGTLVAARRGAVGLAAGCGALLGFAALLKYTTLAAALPLALAAWLGASGTPGAGARTARVVGAGVVGTLAVLGGCALALVATGTWGAFAEIQFELVPQYVTGRHKGDGVLGTLQRAVELTSHQVDLAPVLIAGPLGLLAAWRALPWASLGLVVLWWALGALGLLLQGKFYDYHYLPLLAPGAILLGAGVDALIAAVPARGRVVAGVALGLVAGGLVLAGPWRQYASEAVRVASGQPRAAVWARVKRYNYRDYDCAEVDAAGAWLAEHTAPDEPVFVWSYDPAILVRARRRQVSRFLYSYPLRVPWADPAWEGEVVDALAADPPAAVVIATGDSTPGVTGHRRDSAQDLQRLPALREALDRWGCEVDRVGRYRMWLPRGRGC